MIVNGCPSESPRIAGLVEYNSKTPSLIVIPRMDLPKGDVELRIKAFDETNHVVFLNYEDGLKVMTSKKQSRWYRESTLSDGSIGVTMDYPKLSKCPADILEED
jgi:hypothetical protein